MTHFVGLGVRVKMHNYHFDKDADDGGWLPVVAKREWVILTKDQFNWLERQAIRNAGRRAFLLVQGSLPGDEQVSIICRTVPRMLRVLDTTTAPFIAKIYKSSEVVVMPDEPLRKRPASL